MGPPTIDWLSVTSQGQRDRVSFWPAKNSKNTEAHLTAHRGGITLLRQLLEKMCPKEKATIFFTKGSHDVQTGLQKLAVDLNMSPEEGSTKVSSEIHPFMRGVKHNWTNWHSYPREEGKPFDAAYRMSGWIGREVGNAIKPDYHFVSTSDDDLSEVPISTGNLFVLDDPGWENKESFVSEGVEATLVQAIKKAFTAEKIKTNQGFESQIILRLAMENSSECDKFEKSSLYQYLKETSVDGGQPAHKLAAHTTIVTTLANLRNEDNAPVQTSLSWEQLFDAVVHSISNVFGDFSNKNLSQN